MKEVSILIPARAGSKRIPNKNVVDICGRPMIEYCIEESLRVTDKVYVSTDCSKIKKVCAGYKEVTVIDRPAHLATDESTTNSVIAHFLEGRHWRFYIGTSDQSPHSSQPSRVRPQQIYKR